MNQRLRMGVLAACLLVRGLVAGEPLAGGWKEIPVEDAEVRSVAGFACREEAALRPAGKEAALRLVRITGARMQVVAGRNLDLDLVVSSAGRERRATARVWCKLDGARSLTSWHWRETDPPANGPAKPAVPGPSAQPVT